MENKDLSPFEKYLLDNRDVLDQIEEPDLEKMWKEIRRGNLEVRNQKLATSAVNRPNNWHLSIGRNWRWAIAASIVLVLSVYILLPTKTEAPMEVQIAEIFPEIAQQEANYQRLIAQKEDELNLSMVDKKAFAELFSELQQLEEIHKEYLQDLPRYEKNDHLVSILLRYYERKIKILERLSREIEKKKMNHEKIKEEKQI